MKVWSLFFILFVFPIFSKCISGNCTNGYGSAVFPKGDVYTGEWKNGKAEGKGKLEYKNGNVYYGEWKNGRANGIGEMLYADGTKYIGEWVDSHAHGYGIVYDKDNSILYKGRWEKGKMIDKDTKK